MIEDAKQKMEDYNDELMEIPRQIDEANLALMLASMRVCYGRIQQNVRDINEINQWVSDFKVFDMKYNPKNVLNKEKDLIGGKTPGQE